MAVPLETNRQPAYTAQYKNAVLLLCMGTSRPKAAAFTRYLNIEVGMQLFSKSGLKATPIVTALLMALGVMALSIAPTPAFAQLATESVEAPVESITDAPVVADDSGAVDAEKSSAQGSYTPMKPVIGKGMPVDSTTKPLESIGFQDQYSAIGRQAESLNNILLVVITLISIFVLALMAWVIIRYRAKANPVPSKTTHNSLIEILWTAIPALILVFISIPSIGLLSKQYETAPAGSLTVKVTGYQWYWGYTYPDNGDFEIVSNMLDKDEAAARGEPFQLAVDNRMVVPVGEPIRIITTGADVIHSFAVPSLWFKLDTVPGRLNEKVMTIDEPGVYYGQCSELCGARHGFMPIAIEALPREKFEQWVLAQGGTNGDAATAQAAPADDNEAVETDAVETAAVDVAAISAQ